MKKKKEKRGNKIVLLNTVLFKKNGSTCVIYIVFCLLVFLMLVESIFQQIQKEI